MKETGTKDIEYNLVSILYHALQGVETYGMYLADAEKSGNRELIDFLRQTIDDEKRIADRAKSILQKELGGKETIGMMSR